MNIRFPAPLAALLAAAASLFAARARAQTSVQAGAVSATLGGRLHTQFNTTSAPAVPASEFAIRRARLDAKVQINRFLSGMVQPEFGEGKVLLRVAYAKLDAGAPLSVTIGQFKRPFDRFELTSSNDILVIERTGDIRGVDACSGVGGVCSLSRLVERLQLGAPDIGIMIEGKDRSGRLGYFLALTNGTGANREDENGSKSFTGRLTLVAAPGVELGAGIALHDYVDSLRGTDRYAPAWGLDLEVGNFSRGFHLQAGVVGGANWSNFIGADPARFFAAQVIATYKAAWDRPPYAEAIEPVARVSWADPATAASGDAGFVVTPGLVWYITGRHKMAANVDFWIPERGERRFGLKLQSYLSF
ncbi:MAG: hypothetical protein KatS3mg081_1618 [Gemmatimonadales bacterium]|nr:MAG: hypothetical protein KatS3mg081_1618 [Gemmatimonadales bacterium]